MKIWIQEPRDEDQNALIFGLPDPVLFSPDPDSTCNNGYMKLCIPYIYVNPSLPS